MMMIKTRPEQMLADTLAILEMVLTLPDGDQRFQRQLSGALEDTAKDLPALVQAITLASAALTVADNGNEMFASWYREQSQSMLRRAMECIAVLEVQRPDGVGLN